jgi:hypothetical protein
VKEKERENDGGRKEKRHRESNRVCAREHKSKHVSWKRMEAKMTKSLHRDKEAKRVVI